MRQGLEQATQPTPEYADLSLTKKKGRIAGSDSALSGRTESRWSYPR